MMLHKKGISLALFAAFLIPVSSLQAVTKAKGNPKDRAWQLGKIALYIAGTIGAYKLGRYLTDSEGGSYALAGGIATYGAGDILDSGELKEIGKDVGFAGASVVTLKTKVGIKSHNAIADSTFKKIDATEKRSHSTFALESMTLWMVYRTLFDLASEGWRTYKKA